MVSGKNYEPKKTRRAKQINLHTLHVSNENRKKRERQTEQRLIDSKKKGEAKETLRKRQCARCKTISCRQLNVDFVVCNRR